MKEFNINEDHILVSYHGPGGHIRIPDEVTAIGGGAFTFGNVNSIFQVVIPEGVETIGFRAFEGGGLLTRVHLPSTLKTIEHNAFSDCLRLERISLPEGLEAIESEAFGDCWHLESPVFPKSLKYIGPRAFSTCSAITEITLPEQLEQLGDAAFFCCISLKRVTIASSLKAIPSGAFQNCDDLEEVTLPEGLEEIDGNAFSGCGNLKSLTIPGSVHTIGPRAFTNCISLSDAMILPPVLSKIGANAFEKCPIPAFSMEETCLAAFSYRCFPGGNAGIAANTAAGWRFYAYAAKSGSDSLSDFVRKGKWNMYDMELINNGPMYKYKAPARLLGSLGRLVDPVELTGECKELHLEFLIKNARKLIPLAESLRCPAIVEAMKECGVINDKNKKAIAKLLAASQVPEIAAIGL